MSDVWITATSEPEWAAFAAIDWADQKNSLPAAEFTRKLAHDVLSYWHERYTL